MYPICHSSNETLIITFFAFVVSVDLGFLLPEQKYLFSQSRASQNFNLWLLLGEYISSCERTMSPSVKEKVHIMLCTVVREAVI